MRVTGVYNAEGTLRGEITYMINKLRGRGACALCDITHGWNPLGKQSWRERCADSPLEVTLLHLEELSAEQREAMGRAPAFIARRQDRWVSVMSEAEIIECAGDPDELLLRLERVVSALNEARS